MIKRLIVYTFYRCTRAFECIAVFTRYIARVIVFGEEGVDEHNQPRGRLLFLQLLACQVYQEYSERIQKYCRTLLGHSGECHHPLVHGSNHPWGRIFSRSLRHHVPAQIRLIRSVAHVNFWAHRPSMMAEHQRISIS